MLAQHRVVLLDREFLGHGAGVLLGDIEKAGTTLAVEADLGSGGLRHGNLQKSANSRGGGLWPLGSSLSSFLPVFSAFCRETGSFCPILTVRCVLAGRYRRRFRPG